MTTPILSLRPVPTRWRRWGKLFVATLRHWNADNASMWAASLAFYTMLSLGPLIFLVVALSGMWLGEHAAQEAVMREIASSVGPQAADAARSLANAARHENTGVVASVIGFLTLVFGASGVFAALQDAMDAIWHVAPRPDAGWAIFIKRRFLSLAMVAGVGFLLIVSFMASTMFAVVQHWVADTLPMAWLPTLLLDTLLAVGMLTLSFGAMYKVLPDAKLNWRDVWLGAVVTALLFHIGKLALGVYFANSHIESGYGAAGSLALILIWVYYAAQIFFLGAEFVRAHVQSSGREVKPARHAMAVKTIEVKGRGDMNQAFPPS